MRIAVLSDIHGNYHALIACLSHAIGHGATTFWFLDVTRVPSRAPVMFPVSRLLKKSSDSLNLSFFSILLHPSYEFYLSIY